MVRRTRNNLWISWTCFVSCILFMVFICIYVRVIYFIYGYRAWEWEIIFLYGEHVTFNLPQVTIFVMNSVILWKTQEKLKLKLKLHTEYNNTKVFCYKIYYYIVILCVIASDHASNVTEEQVHNFTFISSQSVEKT